MKLSDAFLNSMHKAMALLRTHGPAEATEAIQRALRGEAAQTERPTPSPAPVHEPVARRPASTPMNDMPPPGAEQDYVDMEDQGYFSTHTYSNAAGRRQYRLYVPPHDVGESLPLIVMLHGCTQNADDFAAGTQMNALAAKYRCLVAYPVQPQQANMQKCWNWFKPDDQQRERGEPSLIAGITREIMAARRVDPDRVYVAGLSAGGAMAAIMIDTYPDLYAAAGVHSGLAVRSAHDLPSALAAMKGGKGLRGVHHVRQHAVPVPKRPIIVFHGDADATVHIRNAAELIEGFDTPVQRADESKPMAIGRRTCTVSHRMSPDGIDAELWTIHGAPHAWAGGNAQGSYTDPSGPDASAEMLRFFLDHPQRR